MLISVTLIVCKCSLTSFWQSEIQELSLALCLVEGCPIHPNWVGSSKVFESQGEWKLIFSWQDHIDWEVHLKYYCTSSETQGQLVGAGGRPAANSHAQRFRAGSFTVSYPISYRYSMSTNPSFEAKILWKVKQNVYLATLTSSWPNYLALGPQRWIFLGFLTKIKSHPFILRGTWLLRLVLEKREETYSWNLLPWLRAY